MNKLLVFSLLLALSSGVFAQHHKVVHANKQHVEQFFNTKTMVVLDASPFSIYNVAIREAMEKHWTITPYEIITHEQFDARMLNNPEYSFIWKPTVERRRDRERVHYLFMDVILGGRTKKGLSDKPVLVSIPLAYTGVDADDYLQKLPLMVRFVQLHINNMKAAKNPKSLRNLSNYNKTNSIRLKDMTLLVQQGDLSQEVNTLEKIRAVYPGVVKIVELEELAKAITEKAPNTAVLHQIGPAEDENEGLSWRQIYGTEDAKLYFFRHDRIRERRPQGLLARDFRNIRGKLF